MKTRIWKNFHQKFIRRISKRIFFELLVIILTISAATQVFSLTQTNTTVTNVGSVKTVGVGVYSDATLATKVSSINWGTIDQGSNKNFTVYIKNEGNTAVTLIKNTMNWTPSNAANFMTLNWNYGGQSIGIGAYIQVKLTLAVSASISGITSFSFDIVIVGTG